MEKLITVIVPVYNVETYVERCLDSIVTQDYKNMEIIVVDDGSTDRSGTICDAYALKDKRIKVIHKENGGLGEARNSALNIMKGEYVFFVDSDDYILSGIIRCLFEACEKEKADIACCGFQSGKKVYYRSRKVRCFSAEKAVEHLFCSQGMDSNAVCKLYKAYLFHNMRYPAYVHQVIPVTYKIFLSAKKIVNTGKVGYYVEKRDGSITRSQFGMNDLLYLELGTKVYEDVLSHYRELADAARTFYLILLIGVAERAVEDDNTKECAEREESLNEFRRCYKEILRNNKIPFRKRLIALLIKMGFYNTIHKKYVQLRG